MFFSTATFALSGVQTCVTPPKYRKALLLTRIQFLLSQHVIPSA